MENHQTHIGIDVSKEQLDIVVHQTGEYKQLSNSKAGIKKLISWILPLENPLVVMESTGSYCTEVSLSLYENNIDNAIVNAKWVRSFAQSKGQLAKTDKIDASLIAEYAKIMEPKPKKLYSKNHRQLKELVLRRKQIIKMRTMEKGHLEASKSNEVMKSIKQTIKQFDKQVDIIEQKIDTLVETIPEYLEKVNQIETVPGISRTTAVLLVAELPELGQCNRQEIAALAGVAPMNKDSGKYSGYRYTRGGRASVRTALYMCAMNASRHNPAMKIFYDRLKESGKKPIVALIAVMRKMLTILNAMIKNQEPWIDKTINI